MKVINLKDYEVIVLHKSEFGFLKEAGYCLSFKDLTEDSNLLLEIVPEVAREEAEKHLPEPLSKEEKTDASKVRLLNMTVLVNEITEPGISGLLQDYYLFLNEAVLEIIRLRLNRNWGLDLDTDFIIV